jgi:hypothetical protein
MTSLSWSPYFTDLNMEIKKFIPENIDFNIESIVEESPIPTSLIGFFTLVYSNDVSHF